MLSRAFALLDSRLLTRIGNVRVLLEMLVVGALLVSLPLVAVAGLFGSQWWLALVGFTMWLVLAFPLVGAYLSNRRRGVLADIGHRDGCPRDSARMEQWTQIREHDGIEVTVGKCNDCGAMAYRHSAEPVASPKPSVDHERQLTREHSVLSEPAQATKRHARHVIGELERSVQTVTRALERGRWWDVNVTGLQSTEWLAARDLLAENAPAAYDGVDAVYALVDVLNTFANQDNHTFGPAGRLSNVEAHADMERFRELVPSAIEALRDYCAGGVQVESPTAPLDYWANRRLLARALKRAYRDGLFWHGEDVDRHQWAGWAKRTQSLIREALTEEAAQEFDTDWTRGSSSLTGLPARQQRLFDLILHVQDIDRPLELRANFDGRDWVSRK